MTPHRLPLHALVVYGFMTLPIAIAGLPIAIYIPPFYTQELGLDLTTVGIVLMVARITDVLIDPVTGLLSDRLRTRIGRRRPWVLAGTPIMMLGTWKLFVPPVQPSAWYALGWISVLYLGWTFIAIPYGAWGAELSSSYHERSRITGAREMWTVTGLLVAAAVPAIVAGGQGGMLAPGLRALATTCVVLLPLAACLLLFVVPEPPRSVEPASLLGWRHGLALVWRNTAFRRLLASAFIGGVGSAFNWALAILFYTHVVRIGRAAQVMLLVYFAAGVLAVPFWVALSRRLTKHRTLCYAVVWACSWFLLTPFLPAERVLPVLVLNLMAGLSMAVPQALGGSMAADVIDLDTVESGEGRAALYIALLSSGTKAALALGVGLALPLLDGLGFRTRGPNGPAELSALTGLFCVVPVGIWLLSIAPLWNFPITPERQKSLREAIEGRAVVG